MESSKSGDRCLLVLPGDSEFAETLANSSPPNIQGKSISGDWLCLVEKDGGLLEWVNERDLEEWIQDHHSSDRPFLDMDEGDEDDEEEEDEECLIRMPWEYGVI